MTWMSYAHLVEFFPCRGKVLCTHNLGDMALSVGAFCIIAFPVPPTHPPLTLIRLCPLETPLLRRLGGEEEF